MIVLISESNFHASIIFMRVVSAAFRGVLSLCPASRSIRCWGVKPSGPPDEPRGKVRRDFPTSSGLICNGVYLIKLPVGSMGARRSMTGPGCFSLSA